MATESFREPAPFPETAARATRARHVVLGALCAIAALNYIQRNCLSNMGPEIRGDLELSEAQWGVVLSCFFLPYSLAQIPSGLLADRVGSRRALSLYAIVWSLGTALMGAVGGLASLVLVRSLVGVSQAGIFPCSTNTIARWLPVARRSFASGILTSFMSVGSVLAGPLTGYLIVAFGWRATFVLLAIPGGLWVAWFYAWFRDRPEEHPRVNAEELALIREEPAPAAAAAQARAETPQSSRRSPALAMLLSLPMWLICTQQFCRAAAYLFYTSWFPDFLQQTYDLLDDGHLAALNDFLANALDRTRPEVLPLTRGLLFTVPVIAVVFGAPLGGALSDRLLVRTGNRVIARNLVAAVTLVLAAIAIAAAAPIARPVPGVLLISVGSFFAAMAAPIGYTITMDMGGKHMGTVFSTMNMAGNFGAFALPMVVPFVKQKVAAGTFDAAAWDSVIWLVAGIYLLAAVCWMLLNPRGTIFDPPGRTQNAAA